MNQIKIKFGTKLKPTKHIVVNYNFTNRLRGTEEVSTAKILDKSRKVLRSY